MISKAQILREAQVLASFSNASTEMEADYIRNNYSDFFPQNFWNWGIRPLSGGPILTMDAAPAEAVQRLRSAPPIPFWQAFQRVLAEAWQQRFPLEACVRLISCAAVPDRLSGNAEVVTHDLESYPVWPYQRAVMFLAIEPWRARSCHQCRKRFAADKQARRFCGDRCASLARKQSRRTWWNEHGEKWRAKYRRRKAIKKGSKR